MKKIFFIFFLLMFVAATCNRQSSTSSNNPPPPASSSDIMDVNQWQAFTDTKSGFSFKYPSVWHVSQNTGGYLVCLTQASDNSNCAIGIKIQNYTTSGEGSPASNEALIKNFDTKNAAQ